MNFPTGQHLSILIVDNDPNDLEIIKNALPDHKYHFYYAIEPKAIWEKIRTTSLDLILLDVMSFKEERIRFSRQLKHHPHFHNIPLLIITAINQSEDLNRCINLGAEDFIQKPFNSIELQARVSSLLGIRHQQNTQQVLLETRENELLRANDQLQAVIDAVPGFVSWIGEDLHYLGVNHHLAQALGITAEEFKGKPLGFSGNAREFPDLIQDFFHDPNRSTTQVFLNLQLREELRKYLIVAQKYEQGRSVVTVGIDITERYQAEQELRVTTTQLQTLIQTLNCGVLLQDKSWKVILSNQVFCELFPIDAEANQLIGKTNLEMEAGYKLYLENAQEFCAKTQTLLQEKNFLNNEEWELKDGRVIERDYTPIILDGLCQGHLWMYRDITDRKLYQTELEKSMERIEHQYREIQELNATLEERVKARTHELQEMVLYNSLTGLPSRFSLLQYLSETLSSGQSFALLYFDCDSFHTINSSFGYEVGDALLLAIRDRATLSLGVNDILAHLGEDDFCFLLRTVESEQQVQNIIAQVFEDLSLPFHINEQEIYITISMGVVQSSGSKDEKEVLQNADSALNWAKTNGKNQYQIFQEEMRQKTIRWLQLARDLRRALEEDEFRVYYQPILDIQNHNRVTGFEALIRWQHPEEGLISPQEFIPCLEETGLIIPTGMIVLEKACSQLKQWQEEGFKDLNISVNLSAVQFTNDALVSNVESILDRTKLSPACLKLEITESVIMKNPNATVELIQAFRKMGIKLCIDDFGTGYSSLSYLQKFPVDTLKIDRSFVNLLEADADENNQKIICAIVNLGQVLGMSITAEGIETASQLTQLKQLRCEYGQGYHFAKPMTADDARKYLTINN